MTTKRDSTGRRGAGGRLAGGWLAGGRRGVRRWVAAVLGATLAIAPLGGCGDGGEPAGPWHGGVLVIGTGNPTGVYYQVGGGYADAISGHLDGYEALVAPTAGAADNLLRLDAGDVDVALTFADVAADAMRGTGAFTGSSPRIRAIGAIYRSYVHLIVRTDSGIKDLKDLRGKRISTGALNSGTEFLALRLIRAAGLHPDRDIRRTSLSLSATTRNLANGTLDATFWTGGLPTVGISELLDTARGEVRFLPVEKLLPVMEQNYPGTYISGAISAEAYGLSQEVATVTVNNLIVVPEDMPAQLAYDLTALIFERKEALTAAHPEWGGAEPHSAAWTGVVPLHPGAERYYREH